MKWFRDRRRPVGRRAALVAVALSILLPGLGHSYTQHLPRAMVWFAGTILVGLVLEGGKEDTALSVGMFGALGLLAAADVALAMWLDGRPSGPRR